MTIQSLVRRCWATFSYVGLVVATLLFAASLTPSLLPRHFAVQGLLSGLALAVGYGVGVFSVWLWDYLELRKPKGRSRMNKSHARVVCASLLALLLLSGRTSAGSDGAEWTPQYLWYPQAKEGEKDYYIALRGTLDLPAAAEVQLKVLGAAWYVVWCDGQYLTEGPPRFPITHPEYQTRILQLAGGKHVIAIQVHQIGCVTRMLDNPPPFLFCRVEAGGQEVPVRWKCERLAGYASEVRRINPQLGFIEWCDTRALPSWRAPDFDDTPWLEPAVVDVKLGSLKPLSTADTRALVHRPQMIGSGTLSESYGYEQDNPAARFFLRDLSPNETPPQGVWRRYDLGRVRLARPRFVLNVPAGSVIEFAYSEALSHERVSPWITLSAGDSCNLDHYVARGGEQEFSPLTPKGGRFLEVHVLASPEQVEFLREEVVERCYYEEVEGSFRTDDETLNHIWNVGVATHVACSEDSLVDSPTRERGQWAGDVVGVGMDVAAVAFSDVRLFRRGLVQCAQCARPDGMVAGLCPGGVGYLSTYAAQWVSAAVHYWELTGDLALLEELFPYAERNVAAFEKQRTADGLQDALGWGFVDWGYVRNPGPSDMGVNLHYLAALRDMVRWCEALDRPERAAFYRGLTDDLTGLVRRYFDAEFAAGGDVWPRIGYHRAALGLRLGFFAGDQEGPCVAAIKQHMLQCFPNDAAAPRLSDPGVSNSRLITPYFGHFVLPELIERGEMEFVLSQYRQCWGWALGDGRTTWLEVFDTRWSHCHQWSGCPTWQMSRYVLGLQPRYDLGQRHYVLAVVPGGLARAEGKLPLSDGQGVIEVQWSREADGLHYQLQTPRPIFLHLDGQRTGGKARVLRVDRTYAETIQPAVPENVRTPGAAVE
ncbi:MAG: alpha-L-rhamnosidase-related protein [Pirellulaceae bacterium]